MKKNRSNNYTKTHNLYKIIFLFVVFLGIGYAFLEATLNINGDVTVEAPELNVYVQSTRVTSGSTTGTPTIIGTDKKEVDFTTALTSDVNSFFEETTTLVNKGSKDAYLQSIDVKIYDGTNEVTLAAPYEYTLTNNDGTVIEPGHKLTISGTDTYKIKFNYISGTDMTTVTTYPNYTFKITYNYTTHSFADDDWDTIISNYQTDPNYYPLGGSREVQLDLNNDGTSETTAHLRIANLSTPAECRDGNRGGWEYSDMRAFLNNGKYLEGEEGAIDYTNTGIYSALPSELRNKIIETKVVSGHGSKDSTNFTTTDKIYLLDAKEIYGDSFISSYNTAKDVERQLDYYKAKGVTTSNNSEAIKKNLSGSSTYWWLRSAPSYANYSFFYVSSSGDWSFINSSGNASGVAPAFRIA